MNRSSDGAACTPWDNSACEGTPYCQPRCPRFFDDDGAPILIGPFEDDDFDPLVAMYDRLGDDARTSGLPPVGREATERWLDRLTDAGWNLLARHEDRVVGHVGVSPADDQKPEFVVFVDDDYQGRGIGTELVKQLVAYAAARGHDGLTLSVQKDNERAIELYENVSFEVEKEELATLGMHLSLKKPIAEAVQRPPAER